MIQRETADKFGPMLAKLREELGPHLGTGGGLIEILEGIAGLREKVEEQAKEVERLRTVLDRALIVMHGYRDDHPEDFGVFENNALRNAEAALKEDT